MNPQYACRPNNRSLFFTKWPTRQNPAGDQNILSRWISPAAAQYSHVPVTGKELLEAVCIQLENNLQVKQYQKKNFCIVSLKPDENSIGQNNEVEKIHEIPTKRIKETLV